MDIKYQDVICVSIFKAAADGSVTRACVSSLHPAVKESSPVLTASSSSPLTLSFQGYQAGTFTPITRLELLHMQEQLVTPSYQDESRQI